MVSVARAQATRTAAISRFIGLTFAAPHASQQVEWCQAFRPYFRPYAILPPRDHFPPRSAAVSARTARRSAAAPAAVVDVSDASGSRHRHGRQLSDLQ